MTTSQGWLFSAILFCAVRGSHGHFCQDRHSQRGFRILATLIRTVIILFVLGGFAWFAGKWSNPFDLSSETWLFLSLSALATGASWVCYFRALQLGEASKVAPVDNSAWSWWRFRGGVSG